MRTKDLINLIENKDIFMEKTNIKCTHVYRLQRR